MIIKSQDGNPITKIKFFITEESPMIIFILIKHTTSVNFLLPITIIC